MKKKNLIIILGVVLLLVVLLVILFIINSNKLTDLERIKIEDNSKDVMLFMEEVETSKDIDRFIAYALEYSYNLNDKDILTAKEIKELIQSKFNVELKEDSINDVGVTPYLLDKHIAHDPEEKTYSINKKDLTQAAIAKIPVVKYEISKIKKKGKKYIVTYNKYVVENPYEVLNYYNDMTGKLTDEEKENYTPYDTSDIYNYLTCKGKITSVKEAIDKDNIEKVGKVDKEITVTYIIKDDKLLIDEVK